MPTIYKSSFVRGLQCHKSLYLHLNEPALKESLYDDTDPVSIQQKRTNLLEYCKMDTLAMVELLKTISQVE